MCSKGAHIILFHCIMTPAPITSSLLEYYGEEYRGIPRIRENIPGTSLHKPSPLIRGESVKDLFDILILKKRIGCPRNAKVFVQELRHDFA